MLLDITLKLTPEMLQDEKGNVSKSLVGHTGTHFDGMDKEFPLEYIERDGLVLDVSGVGERDIDVTDVDLNAVEKDMFVAFYTGYIAKERYGTRTYFAQHPQLSVALIDALLDKGVSIIGLDFAGMRRGAEHVPTDRRCADKGVFVIENLCDLDKVLEIGGRFTAHTYPLNCTGVTGLPCRVIAKVAPRTIGYVG